MFNIGGGELIVILLIALIVLGPQRLPDAARQLGKAMGDLRRLSTGFQDEMKQAIETAPEAAPEGSPAPTDPVADSIAAVSAQPSAPPKLTPPASEARAVAKKEASSDVSEPTPPSPNA